MSKSPYDITAQTLVQFHRTLLKELSDSYGGDSTLNELRIMNQIISCSLKDRTCSVTALHKITGIPLATVSRSVASLQEGGWVSERADPNDGRKRILSLGPRSEELTFDAIEEKVEWFKNVRKYGLSA